MDGVGEAMGERVAQLRAAGRAGSGAVVGNAVKGMGVCNKQRGNVRQSEVGVVRSRFPTLHVEELRRRQARPTSMLGVCGSSLLAVSTVRTTFTRGLVAAKRDVSDLLTSDSHPHICATQTRLHWLRNAAELDGLGRRIPSGTLVTLLNFPQRLTLSSDPIQRCPDGADICQSILG